MPRLDQWLASVFDRDAVERTLDKLDSTQQQAGRHGGLAAAVRREIAEADRKLARHRAALEAGADPAVVAAWIEEVQSARLDAEIRLERIGPAPEPPPDRDQLAAMIRELGDMVRLLTGATPERKAKIYDALGLRLVYHFDQSKILVSQAPDRGSIGQRFVSEGGLEPLANVLGLCVDPWLSV